MSFKNQEKEIDILKLFKYLRDKFRVQKIIYFTARFSKDSELYKTISEDGVEIIFKEIYNENSKVKANCDVEISHRITRDLDFSLVDDIVLLSGDGDFVHVLDYAKNLKKKVKVMAANPESCSVVIKRRGYLSVSYLSDVYNLIRNEKPPMST
jgi:uncharacterized LabA/DUF88 family protein